MPPKSTKRKRDPATLIALTADALLNSNPKDIVKSVSEGCSSGLPKVNDLAQLAKLEVYANQLCAAVKRAKDVYQASVADNCDICGNQDSETMKL